MSAERPEYSGLDHVQLTIPQGSESVARRFYVGILGMEEIPKPESLTARGGLWLRIGAHELHLGVEERQPESRRHPGIVVRALDLLRSRLKAAGIDPDVDRPPERPGFNRIHFRDPFGNRLEFMERAPVIEARPAPAGGEHGG
ncbi:MAG TPA: VOC family protein [Dehalococcoidia bacterium]|nr:VOC family protein [Dehalococcoidia bacterium]